MAALDQEFADSLLAELTSREQFSSPLKVLKFLYPEYKITPFLELLEEYMMKVFTEPNYNLIINCPPAQGKSKLLRATLIWALHRDNELKIINTSYSQDKANDNAREVRRGLERLGYKIARDRGAVDEWQLEGHEGYMFSAGVGGALTGNHGHVGIIDDPVKSRVEAWSPIERERNKGWHNSDFETRLLNNGNQLLIQTRWHEDDLAGHLLATQGTVENGGRWHLLNVPAKCVDEENDPLGRKVGEYLESATTTPEAWVELEKSKDSYTWNALYQGNPTPAGNGVFDVSLVRDYWPSQAPLPEEGMWYLSADLTTGNKSKRSDFSVIQVWCKRGLDYFLVDQARGKWNLNETASVFESILEVYPQCGVKVVENAAMGKNLVEEMGFRGYTGFVLFSPVGHGDKETRLNAITPVLESNRIYFPAKKDWVKLTIEELSRFPFGTHDDTVDALSQAILFGNNRQKQTRRRGFWSF